MRDGLKARERLLVDPEKLTTRDGKHFSIDYYTPSLDGKHVAYGISQGGSEESVLHVLYTETGKVMGDTIDRSQFAQPTWLPDGQSFFYTRTQKLGPNAPDTARYQNLKVYYHTLGSDPDLEPPVMAAGLAAGLKVDADDFPSVFYSPAAPKYLLGLVVHGVKSEVTLYVAPYEQVPSSKTPWKKVADEADAVTNLDVHGDDLYVLTHKDASRYKVLKTSLAAPDLTNASVAVPASESVITGLAGAADALYVQELDGGLGRLLRLPYDGGAAQPVKLPFDGAIQGLSTNPLVAGSLVQMVSWTKSPLWYSLDAKTSKMTDTGLVAPSPVDYSKIESEEVKVKSADGTMVPLSIIHQRGLAMDGSHTTWLEGYGAYGITLDPAFRPTLLAFLERGGVFATAHTRGGGEYGEDWHLAGKLLTKQHTVDDFIACAEYLVEHKYTSPAHLAGEGTSAGGITIGGAITQRPELFAAALGESGRFRRAALGTDGQRFGQHSRVRHCQGAGRVQGPVCHGPVPPCETEHGLSCRVIEYRGQRPTRRSLAGSQDDGASAGRHQQRQAHSFAGRL